MPFFDEKYSKVRKRTVADDKLTKKNLLGEKKRKIGKFEERPFIAIRK